LATDSDAGYRRLPIEGRASNHFEMAFTKSEFLLDFGQAYGDSEEPLIHTRIILTPRSAKALSLMLLEILERYEAAVEGKGGA
jgi:hypothetical protein